MDNDFLFFLRLGLGGKQQNLEGEEKLKNIYICMKYIYNYIYNKTNIKIKINI